MLKVLKYMDAKNFEKNLQRFEFQTCQDAEALKLKQEIDEEAFSDYDIAELTTVFLEMRYFSYESKRNLDKVALVKQFLNSLGEPYTKYIVEEPYIENWQKLDEDGVRIRLISLLTGGLSGLTQVFYPNEIAIGFVDRLLLWVGKPASFLANMFWYITPPEQYPKTGPYIVCGSSGYNLFHFPCSSDGVIFISEDKIGIIWCFGCD
jgi:hypothetical protein